MKSSVIKQATTGLAGAVAIAGGSQAYGAIVNVATPANILPTTFPPTATQSSNWDVNGDGVADFQFAFRQPQGATGVYWQADIYELSTSNLVLGYTASITYTGRLTAGTPVASGGGNTFTTGFGTNGNQLVISSKYSGTNYGQFQAPNSTGYLGFKFVVGANTYNGWIQVKTGQGYGLSFINAAYNNTPNGAINAGQTAAVPEPGTVAAVAFGSAALAGAAWRRKKAAKQLAA